MLTINTKEFENALLKCSKFAYKKASLKVLQGVRVEYLDGICTMTATNLSDTIIIKLNSAISDSNIAFILMDIASINKVSKFFTDNISFNLDGNNILVSSGNKIIKF
jgi:DNA polymerase III sliding clamp (beta) subunit (PCNA family)